jgi:hypothetical protein
MSGAVTKVTPEPNFMAIEPGDQILLGFNDFGEPPDPIADEAVALRTSFFQACRIFGPTGHPPIEQGNIVVKFE